MAVEGGSAPRLDDDLFRHVDHIAIAVRDGAAVAERLIARFGLRPRNEEILADPSVRLIELDAGNVTIQVVEPRGLGSIATFLDQHGPGLHHVCFSVDTIEGATAALGVSTPRVFVGGQGRRACFLLDLDVGMTVELVERRSRADASGRGSDDVRSPGPSRERVFVIDDDPTGTQTVSGVRILLDPDRAGIRAFLDGTDPATYLLTNSRTMTRDDAVKRLKALDGAIRIEAALSHDPYRLVLRGDSTLRGHVLAEIDAIADPESVILFVPAYPEAGRVTVDGVQFATMASRRIPVAETEFARDPVFGFRSSDLVAWFAEHGSTRQVVLIPLERVRSGPGTVAASILAAPRGSVVVPDAETVADIATIGAGIRLAEQGGVRVLVRSGSTLAAIYAGLVGRPVDDDLLIGSGRLLIVCGSHTSGSSSQLAALEARGLGVHIVETDADAPDPAMLRDRLIARLEGDRIAVVATPRIRHADDTSMDAAARVMRCLLDVVGGVAPHADGIIAKGGATSAEVALAIGARSAQVVGQLEPGVALWQLDGSTPVPYAVVPGNVGDGDLLWRLIGRFRPIPRIATEPIEQTTGAVDR